ncbi:MAG: hypothetical protein ABI871_04750 [Chthoniobacterales bacterium]
MKRAYLTAFTVAIVLISPSFSRAQGPSAQTDDQQKVAALVKQLQTQQATIADNQAKIDAKLALIAEGLRLARIYTSRGGR